MYFYLLELKQNCTKIYVKETFFLRKGFSFVLVLKKMYFFQNIQAEAIFFAKKTILKIKDTVFRAQKTFFSER